MIYCLWARHIVKRFNKDFTLGNYLFGAVKLTNKADPYRCGYSGYNIGFDVRSWFSWLDGSWGKNVRIFGADMSSSAHVDININISYFPTKV